MNEPIRHHHRPVLQRLLRRVIPTRLVRTTPQHRELFIQIPINKRNQGNRGQQDIGDEGVYDAGERCSQSAQMSLVRGVAGEIHQCTGVTLDLPRLLRR